MAGVKDDRLTFRCPNCDEVDELACDMMIEIRYNALFTDDGDIDLSQASDANAIASEKGNGEGHWYCGNCFHHIFTGTKEELIEHLLTDSRCSVGAR